ncbi:MAG: ABC transporter permease [Gammaproteobacteria bacterium]|nr:ABC transporter permease [Gammaproteobacteria bacterium]
MNLRRLRAILVARNREFLRDHGALSWNILFPVLIIIGFAFAFSSDQIEQYKVGVLQEPDDSRLAFLSTRYIRFIEVDRAQAMPKVERHQLDLLLDMEKQQYWINESSPKGYMLERILKGSGGASYLRQTVVGREVRYVDWLVPGVLAMNMMFSALFGVGYVIVRYRKNGVLKRLRATPISALEFLTAQVISRLWLIVAITLVVYLGMDMIIGFSMHGSIFSLFLVFTLGAFCLISLGLVVAARIRSEEMAGGLLNMVSWPMIFLSGVWFSLEGLQHWVQKMALIFPLTHIIEASRAIMIDGAGLSGVMTHIIVLLVMSVCFLLLGAYSFRWE